MIIWKTFKLMESTTGFAQVHHWYKLDNGFRGWWFKAFHYKGFVTASLVKWFFLNHHRHQKGKLMIFPKETKKQLHVVLQIVMNTVNPSKDLWWTTGYQSGKPCLALETSLEDTRQSQCLPGTATLKSSPVCPHTGFVRVINTLLHNRALCWLEGYLAILLFIFSNILWWAWKV